VQLRTVIISGLIHGALAVSLLRASEHKRIRRATTVAVQSEKKKAEKKPDKPKPPPPKPPTKVAATVPKATPAPASAPRPAAAPIHVAQTFSNDDAHEAATAGGPGLAVLPPRPAAAKPAPATPGKVASALRRRQDAQDSAAAGQGEADCVEEPSKPVPIFKPDIEYTNEARAAGTEGRLVLKLYIGADGSVTNVVIVAAVEAALDAAAIATVQKWRFKPAMRCGKPVTGGEYTLARRFELGD